MPQMACQLNQVQVGDLVAEALAVTVGHEDKFKDFGQAIDALVEDPKQRTRMKAALVGLHVATERGYKLGDIQKVTSWRAEPPETSNTVTVEVYQSSLERRRSELLEEDRRRRGLAHLDALLLMAALGIRPGGPRPPGPGSRGGP